MATEPRYFHDCRAVFHPKASGTAINKGDFLYVGGGNAAPASSQADSGTEAGNQEAFHDAFLGVAMEDAPNGTTTVKVGTKGVWICAAESATYAIGALVGLDEQGSGTALEDQEVVGVAGANLAVGRVVEALSTTQVAVDIVSTVLYGGPQAAA